MLANYHTHTYRCKHAKGEDREYVEAAIRAGMKVLGFSDHCPWVYDDGYVSGIRMHPLEVDDYFDSLQRLKKEYAKEITIYIGFESEYFPELIEAQTKLLRDYPVDYMILGQHFTTREPARGVGAATEDEAFLKRYVDLIIEGIGTGKYLYVAHPDMIKFIGPEQIYEFHMERLLRFLKERNVPIEINMQGVYENRHYTSERFLRIVKRIGNTVIIGVDAHQPERLEYINEQKQCRVLAERYGLPIIEYLPHLEASN